MRGEARMTTEEASVHLVGRERDRREGSDD